MCVCNSSTSEGETETGFQDNSSSLVSMFQANVSKEVDDIPKKDNQDYPLASICIGAFAPEYTWTHA